MHSKGAKEARQHDAGKTAGFDLSHVCARTLALPLACHPGPVTQLQLDKMEIKTLSISRIFGKANCRFACKQLSRDPSTKTFNNS